MFLQSDQAGWDNSAQELKNRNNLVVSSYVIISQLWLTSHQRSTVVLLGTGTPDNIREIYSEDADGETRTHNTLVINRCSSH